MMPGGQAVRARHLTGNQAGKDLCGGYVRTHPDGWRCGRRASDSTQALGAARRVLHPAQHPRNPPVAGHDDPADDPPALVAVGVGVVAQEGLADPPAVAVGTAALGTAVASLIPQGVELQPVLRLPGRASVSTARRMRGRGTPGTRPGHPRGMDRTPQKHGLDILGGQPGNPRSMGRAP